MIQFENSLVIERQVEEVFRFVSDFENMPKWNYFVLEVKRVSGGPPEVGATYDQVRKTDRQQYTIIEYEPGRKVTVQTLPPAQSLQMRFTFEPVEGGTRLTDEWVLESGLPGPLNWVAKGRVKSAVAENLGKLKQLLETGEVQLQDGRMVRL